MTYLNNKHYIYKKQVLIKGEMSEKPSNVTLRVARKKLHSTKKSQN